MVLAAAPHQPKQATVASECSRNQLPQQPPPRSSNDERFTQPQQPQQPQQQPHHPPMPSTRSQARQTRSGRRLKATSPDGGRDGVKNKGGGKGSESSKETAGAGGRGQSDRVKENNRYIFCFFTILFTH